MFSGKSHSRFSSHSSIGFTGSWGTGGDAQAAPMLSCWGAPHQSQSAPAPQHLHGTGQCPWHLLPHAVPRPPRLFPRRAGAAASCSTALSAVTLVSHKESQPFPLTLLLTPHSHHCSLALPNLLLVQSINVKGCTHAFSQRTFQMTNQQY